MHLTSQKCKRARKMEPVRQPGAPDEERPFTIFEEFAEQIVLQQGRGGNCCSVAMVLYSLSITTPCLSATTRFILIIFTRLR
jgi:hypothetical protein